MTWLLRCAHLCALAVLLAPLSAFASDDDELPPPPPIPIEEYAPGYTPEPQPAAVPEPREQPPPVVAPKAAPRPPVEPEKKQVPPLSRIEVRQPEPMQKEPPGFFSAPCLYTLGGAVIGALALGALAFFSPCCCGLPFSIPIGALSVGGGAILGAGLESDGSFRPMLLSGLIAGGCGLASALAGGIAAAVAAQALSSALPDPGVNIPLAQGTTLISGSVAGLVAASALLVGGAAAGAAVTWSYPLLQEEAPPRQRTRRRRRVDAHEIAPALPSAPTVAIAY